MKNQISDDKTWTGAAPYALTGGDGCKVGAIFGVAVNTVLIGAQAVLQRHGVYLLKKTTAQAWSLGVLLYWDDTAKSVTTTSAGNTLIGAAFTAALAADVTGEVIVTGQVG